MFESDADRLAMIRALGGVAISGPHGRFEAIFENPHIAVGDLAVDSTAPSLTARDTDLDRCGVFSGVTIDVGGRIYLARSMQPDGLGMTVVDLEEA